METPSSTRMATISQASVVVVASSQKIKKEDQSSSSTCYLSQSRTKASSLVDITNDSPIVGLANGKTPSSSIAKNRVRVKNTTPGSGEAILRGQVKTLLQKVEEEAEFVVNNKNNKKKKNQQKAMVNLPGPSPIQLLAPTPMNTPQLPGGVSEFPLQDSAPIQIAEAVGQKECLINRALLFDSPDKSDAASVSSAVVTYQGSEIEHKSPEEDDSSSAWSSIQVNVSVEDDEEDDGDAEDYEEEEEEEYEEGFDELCEGLSKMTVEEEGGVPHLPEFTGKLTRFVYNSDDEIEGEEVVVKEKEKEKVSPSVMVLKGLPVPEGKHLRFQDDE